MTMTRNTTHGLGLTAGPLAWAVNTQLNYALTDWQCIHNANATLPAAAVLALLALGGVALSARALQGEPGSSRLLSVIGIGLGLLSAAVILAQGAASVVIDPCAR
jgi:hypothetical protein